MSKFGWSYPPGCNYVPGDEVGAVDLTDLCDPLPTGVVGVFWDENDCLIEQQIVFVPADYVNNVPEYRTVKDVKVGKFPWNDNLEINRRAAASYYERNRHASR